MWDAPASCPGAEFVLRAAAEMKGVEQLELHPLRRVHGRVVVVGGAWQLWLSVLSGDRRLERRFSAPSCNDLSRAAAVAIALAVDAVEPAAGSDTSSDARGDPVHRYAASLADATGSHALDAPASDTGTTSTVGSGAGDAPGSPVAIADPVAAPELAVEPDVRAAPVIAARAVLDAGSLPAVSLGSELGLGVRQGGAGLLAYGLFLPEQTESMRGGGRLAFSLLTAGLHGCYWPAALQFGSAQPSACVTLEYGRVQAHGIGLAAASRYNDDWLAMGAGLELAIQLAGVLFWTVRADALFPVWREEYFVNESERVYRPALPALRVGLGVGVTFE